jgi:cyclic beta-1,2-glucan synthetase
VDEEKLTNSYYDLLASEARITSFLAVARGEVPTEHWFRLGKSLTYVEGYKGLVSWSGTMFEYFMPCLIMKDYPNTLLSETYHFALLAQKRYGKKRGVPGGLRNPDFSLLM